MKATLIILFLVVNSFISLSQSAEKKFELGNTHYQSAAYDSALNYYESILADGKTSASLYYNTGNAYYKKGMLAEAILYYEKAVQLAPDDVDINNNLEIARARTIDKIDPLPQIFYKRWINDIKNLFSPDSWAIITVVLIWLFFISLTVYIISRVPSYRKMFFVSGIIFMVLLMTSGVIAYDRYNEITSGNSAIVFETSVYVKSSPEEKSTNLFMLHEGTKVEILEELSNWRKIKIANGSVGWINENAIRVI